MSASDSKSPGSAAPRAALKLLTKVHVFLHRLTGGRAFNSMSGAAVCFVTMTGAKSGREITIPLVHLPYGEGALLVASQTGRDTHPVWYHNIVKHPDIEIRYRTESKRLRAREATASEKETLWPICDEIYSDFALYRARTTRDIPIFICEKT